MIQAKVEVYYSLQSDYCYFLLDRLLQLSQKQVAIVIQPILGGVLRLPERFKDRDELEQNYFLTDAARTADFLDLPYATPNPSPITFKPGSLWVAEDEQPRNEYLYRLFVGSTKAGYGLEFLDKVGRMLWDGSTPDWAQGDNLEDKMREARLMASSISELRRAWLIEVRCLGWPTAGRQPDAVWHWNILEHPCSMDG